MAATAAALDQEPGRTWRPLEDTAVAAQVLYGARQDYSEYRRSVDYYALKPYTFEDVVSGLNSIQPYDWGQFLNERLRATEAHAPLGGIEGGGWKLSYNGTRSSLRKANKEERKVINLSYSIGFTVKEDGAILDVAYGHPAHAAVSLRAAS